MIVSVEISLYPLSDEFEKPVDIFLNLILQNKNLKLESGKMSSLITGELSEIMETLAQAMEKVFENNPAVFNLKVANCCPV